MSFITKFKINQSGWPSGLRRYVQVVVYSVGVGSNPTPDKMFCEVVLY